MEEALALLATCLCLHELPYPDDVHAQPLMNAPPWVRWRSRSWWVLVRAHASGKVTWSGEVLGAFGYGAEVLSAELPTEAHPTAAIAVNRIDLPGLLSELLQHRAQERA